LFNSGTILAVLSDQEIPAYTLSNGTLYKKGDKIETAEVLCNQLPKVAYGNYPPLGYKISTPIALSVTGLKKGTTRYIHLYAMSYHCDGSPVYSELCHTITFSTAIDMPKQFAVDGLPTANSVTVNATPADGYGTIIVKSRKSTPPSLSGNLAKGDMIGQDAQVMEILNTATTLSIPLDENERCHLFAYTADLSDPDAPLYAPNALALSVRAAYPGLPGLIEFTGESYTTPNPRDPNFVKTFRDLPIGWTRETAVAETIRNYAFGLGKPGYDNRLKTALYAQVHSVTTGTISKKTTPTEFDVITPPIVCDKDRVLVTYNVAMLQSPPSSSSSTEIFAIDPNADDVFKIEYKIEEGNWIQCAS
ncbi:MAG: hypothetical protein K2O01_00025, partial [Bacteroidales bacterium]|nr:hypothetical protein [Bacteroidales bacterium]